MGRRASRWHGIAALALAAASAGGRLAWGQALEPRDLSPAPVGMNFAGVIYDEARGGLSLDPALDLINPNLKVAGPALAYVRAVDLFGRTAKVGILLPYTRLDGTATFQGQTVERKVQGLEDPVARASVTLYGAPAMTPEQFRSYKQGLLIAASLEVAVPLGAYDRTKLLNLGTNRWAVRPELGLSQSFGRWVLELQTDVTLFTVNDDFFGGHRREEAPIYAHQVHLIYNWPSGAWASIDATYFTGGRGKIDGVLSGTSLEDSRAGGTFILPLTVRHSLKFFGSAGVSTRTHSDFGLFGIVWQYRWGAGV